MSAVTTVPPLMSVDIDASLTRTSSLFDNLGSLDHGVEQNVGAGGRPFLLDVFVLVVAEPVDAWAHHHRRRRDAVDPAGVMAGAGNNIAVGVTEADGGIAHRLDATGIE